MPRISVIGTSGSGKTTLARDLARLYNIPHIELDALHWGPNWNPTPTEKLRPKVENAIAVDSWTTCGNYGSVRDLIWSRADTIIWLDYSMSLVARRVAWRTIRRCVLREKLWADNRERFLVQLFSTDSLFLWVINSWRRHRRDYPGLLRQQAGKGKRILRFRTPTQTDRWIKQQQSFLSDHHNRPAST